MNEVIQLILHDGDPTSLGHRHRRLPLELKDTLDLSEIDIVKPSVNLVSTDPSPRVLTTHCRPHHYPEQTWNKRIPIIYLMRNPKGIYLSMFEFYCSILLNGQSYWNKEDFDRMLLDFVAVEVPFDGWCQHVISFEELERRNENVLIVTYEEMKKDISSVVRRVAKHIKRDITENVIAKVLENSTLEAMRRNYEIAMEERKKDSEVATTAVPLPVFLKKGVAGRWKEEYPEKKWRPLQEQFREETKSTIYAKQYF